MGEFVHWNINGLKCTNSQNFKDKNETICSILEKHDTSVLNLQETHFLDASDFPQFVKIYKHLFHFISTFATNNDPSAGILVCISKKFVIEESEILENGRLLYIKFQNKANNESQFLFSSYLKSGNTERQQITIDKIRNKLLENENLAEKCFIIGDFNFVTNILDRNSMSLNNTDLQSTRSWQDLEGNFGFQDAFRLSNPKRRVYSFCSRANQKFLSRIDRLYISSHFCSKILSSSYITTSLSDHKIYKTSFSPEVDMGNGH